MATESKKTDAWMPLWIGAYLADTQHLTRDEHGGYMLLLMAYWRSKGPLPDDDKRLSAIVKATPKEWRLLRPVLAEFFQVEGGLWSQRRMDAELASAKVRSEKAASKAKTAAEARWGQPKQHSSCNATSTPQAMPEQCPTPTPDTSLRSVSKDKVPRFDPRRLDLPAGLSPDKWCEWVSYRSKRRPALTEETAAKQLALLGNAISDGHSADEMIEASIRNGWQGLFPPKPVQRPPAARSAMNRIGIDSQTPEGWGDGSDL